MLELGRAVGELLILFKWPGWQACCAFGLAGALESLLLLDTRHGGAAAYPIAIPCLSHTPAGTHGPTPAALQAYQAARQPANSFVHAQSLQMHRDFQSGLYKPGGSPPLELTRSVQLGLWAKRFESLVSSGGSSGGA